jgi:hypothetical protein
MITAFVMMFVCPKRPMNERRNLFVFRLGQDLLFANYVLAGAWKVLNLFTLRSWDEIRFSFQKSPFEHIGYTMASASANPHHVALIVSQKWLGPWIFSFFILLQFFSFLAIWKTWLKVPWAYALIAFHLSMAIVMGLPFDYAVACLLFQVIMVDELLKRETRKATH